MDRAFTVYVAGPWRRIARSPCHGVPILMYHSISEFAATGRHPYFALHTPARVFIQQMAWLKENGYETLLLSQLRGQRETLPGNEARQTKPSVVITFDDGFRDFYTNAFPILQRFGMTATMFLPTAYVRNHRRRFLGRGCLTWNEVREMRRAGIAFGSHTVSHPKLSLLPHAEFEWELAWSKREIEEETGEVVTAFSHPYAFPEPDRHYRKRLRAALLRCGYTSGVTTTLGMASFSHDHTLLRRIPINGFDDSALFEAKLTGAYDWLGSLQRAKKSIAYRVRHG